MTEDQLPDGTQLLPTDPDDPFEMRTGPFLAPAGASEEDFRVYLRVKPEHCNRSGIVHGGLLVTMADLTVCAQAVHGRPEERAITVSLNTDFVAAGELGDLLEAKAEVIRRTRSLVFARGTISAGERTVLTCNAIIKRTVRNP